MSPRLHTVGAFDYNLSDFIIGFAVADIVLISLILGLCLWAAWNPVSRRHLNRVSFRLLIYALVANLGCSGCIICAVKLGPGAACGGTAFFADACILFAALMFFSMALNLQLVIVHGVNGQKMEKYYIGAATIMTLACTIPPYAAGAFGYEAGCWFNSPDNIVRIRWWVGSLGLWLFLLSIGEVFATAIIVGHMVMRRRAVSSIRFGSSVSQTSMLLKSPILVYRKIILRIGLYPLVSCFFIITTGALDLYSILETAQTEVNWRLNIVDLLLYALRPMTYTLLAATDPSFLRAMRALWGSELKASATPVRVTVSTVTWRSSATSSTARPSTNCDTDVGLDSTKTEETYSGGSEESFTRQI
ncbi:hypothetical protein B0H16DRAFT_1024853 [Mycena metata]|uniref:Uncharacterized protein n=1 Tax=Mycena metata TaxID=1033252 RepID=A0AAD7IIG9_9AGAR|nr:hypothetical protein B0H16DRAFT_200588 [Mycena metata]KAJ7742317.1 hypothetical protein B0H16DRAFT_1024853 [Mycena metata]